MRVTLYTAWTCTLRPPTTASLPWSKLGLDLEGQEKREFAVAVPTSAPVVRLSSCLPCFESGSPALKVDQLHAALSSTPGMTSMLKKKNNLS